MKLEIITTARNSPEIIQKRKEFILEWLTDKEIDFEKNCVFLDEAGFNLHISRTRGCSKKGKLATAAVYAPRSTYIAILGVISSTGIINISLKKPITITTGIKRRRANAKIVQTIAEIKARTRYYLT